MTAIKEKEAHHPNEQGEIRFTLSQWLKVFELFKAVTGKKVDDDMVDFRRWIAKLRWRLLDEFAREE
jgi:hypothetical protein